MTDNVLVLAAKSLTRKDDI